MAVIRSNVIVSPSADKVTEEQLNSVILEPGIYVLDSSKTIDGLTSSRWTVIAIANNNAANPHCYTQIWMPAQAGMSDANQMMFMRTLNANGNGYTDFTTMVNKQYITNTAAINKASYPMEIYAQNTQPTAAAGKTIIWIDTAS